MELHNGLHEDDQRSAAVWDATGPMRKGTQRSKSLVPCCISAEPTETQEKHHYTFGGPQVALSTDRQMEIAMSTMS